MPVSHGTALIHNDYKYDNVVLDPTDLTKIVGVLDWEMCTLGDPLTDLGTALAYWADPQDPEEFQEIRSAPTTLPGTLTRAQIVERYASATGRDHGLDTRDMVFYLTFARFKVAVIIQQILLPLRPGINAGRALRGDAAKNPYLAARLMALRGKRDDMSGHSPQSSQESSLRVIANQPLGDAAGFAGRLPVSLLTLDMDQKSCVAELGRFLRRQAE